MFLALLASVLTTHQRYAVLAVVIVATGMCFLLTTVSATIGATTGVTNPEQGLAGGLRQTSFQLGIALGVAALVSVAASHTRALSSGLSAIGQPAALVGGFQLALVVLAGLAVLASAAAFFGFRPARPSHAKA